MIGSIELFGVRFRSPILLAAGTAGFGREVAGVTDLGALGGLVTKSVSLEPRSGNPAPRVAEAKGVMLNSIGLANPGLDAVRADHLPWLRENRPDLPVIVNVVGRDEGEFAAVVAALSEEDGIAAFELNVSCPNVERGGMEFGSDEATLSGLVARVRQAAARPLVVKLSPALTDPARMAVAAAGAGADGFTCVNTLPGLLYDDLEGSVTALGHGSGGVSGPPLLPVGVRMTRIVAEATGKPVIGSGGVLRGVDAWQYLLAGASLVAVGTAALADPRAPERIAREVRVIAEEHGGWPS